MHNSLLTTTTTFPFSPQIADMGTMCMYEQYEARTLQIKFVTTQNPTQVFVIS